MCRSLSCPASVPSLFDGLGPWLPSLLGFSLPEVSGSRGAASDELAEKLIAGLEPVRCCCCCCFPLVKATFAVLQKDLAAVLRKDVTAVTHKDVTADSQGISGDTACWIIHSLSLKKMSFACRISSLYVADLAKSKTIGGGSVFLLIPRWSSSY